MKKTLLSFMMVVSVGLFSAHAQITINSNHIVSAGSVVENAQDTTPSVSIGPSGANQTWNFSTLGQDFIDTLSFKNPVPLPGSSSFPNANIGLEDTGEDSTWIFLEKNSLGLFVHGQSFYQNSNLMTVAFAGTIITFPSTMGTNYGGTWSGILGAFPLGQDPDGPGPHGQVDSLRLTRFSTTNSNIDGWGNVTTPFGTFASLRQNIIEDHIDTTWQLVNGNWEVISQTTINYLALFNQNVDSISYDTVRTARWWTDDPSAQFPVVELEYDANGNAFRANWQKSSPSVGVNENESSKNEFSLFPNPANNLITVNSPINNGFIELFDVTGKLVTNLKINSNKTTISVRDFDNGLYFYNVYNEFGENIHSNKFVVAK